MGTMTAHPAALRDRASPALDRMFLLKTVCVTVGVPVIRGFTRRQGIPNDNATMNCDTSGVHHCKMERAAEQIAVSMMMVM